MQPGQVFASAASQQACSPPTGTLVLGLGNPILGDDGAGWRVAEFLREKLPCQAHAPESVLELDCAALGGIGLMERILGYDRVILIDAVQSGARPPGTVSVCRLEQLADPSVGHSTSAHDASLLTALELARVAGGRVPARIDVVGIDVAGTTSFSEQLSSAVSAAVPQAAHAVLALLTEESN